MKKHIRNIHGKIRHASQHQGFRKYFFNTGWLFAEKGLRLVAGLFVGAYVARYLGPTKFGLLSYAISFVALFSAFASLGLDSIVVRELVKDETKRDKLLGTSFFLRLIGACFIFLCVSIAIYFMQPDKETTTLMYIVVVGMLVQTIYSIDFFFRAKVWSKYMVWSSMVALVVISVLRILFVQWEKPLVWFASLTVLDIFIIGCGLIYFYLKQKYNIFVWRFDWIVAKGLLKDSWPLILSGMAVSLYMKIDQVMITNMLGEKENGIYSVAVRLSELWYFIPAVISQSVFPSIVGAKKISEKLYLKRLRHLYSLLIWLMIGIATVITIFSNNIIGLLYGEAYSASATILSVYVWAGVLVAITAVNGKWVIADGLQKWSYYFTFTGLIINVVVNLLLIPKYGLWGAVYATIMVQLLPQFLMCFINKMKRYPLLILKSIIFPYVK